MQIDNNKALADGLELFKQSKWHKIYNVDDIYRYLIAPIKYNRIRLFYQEGKPIGLVTWCWLDKQAGKDFLQGQYANSPPTPKVVWAYGIWGWWW